MTRRTKKHSKGPRPGFTLVELLVVIGILGVIFGLGVAFLPSVNQRRESAIGAEILQAALTTARQRAKRDNLVTGLKIVFEDATPGASPRTGRTWLQYFQQPPDMISQPPPYQLQPGQPPGGWIASTSTGNITTVNFRGTVDLTPVSVALAEGHAYLEINNSGVPHRIVSASRTSLQLASRLPYAITTPTAYRIRRPPLPLVGEQIIDLPKQIAIFPDLCTTDPTRTTGFPFPIKDFLIGQTGRIMFSPGGGLADRRNLNSDRLVLFVGDRRVITKKNIATATAGTPTLVCIIVRTGYIAAHPVDLTKGGNPYSFCNNPRSSGL